MGNHGLRLVWCAMRYSNRHPKLSRALAAVCALAMCGTLAACGSDSDAGNTKDSGSSSSSASSGAKDTVKGLRQIAGVSATGELGKKPTVSVPKGTTVENNAYAVLQQGDGETIEEGDRVCAQGIMIDAKDASEVADTWTDNTPDCSINLTADNLKQVPLYNVIVGQKLNASVAFGSNDGSGHSYILVYTFISKSRDLTRAEGDEVADVPADLPKVTRAKDGKPSIEIPKGYKPGDSLVAQPLIKGKGKEVTDHNTVVVKYTGWLTDGTQFDSSWDRGSTLDADTYSGGSHTVIDGWQQGMVGQTVGSQVLLVIPPSLGYGDTKQGSIPANSTLIFVVDILAAY